MKRAMVAVAVALALGGCGVGEVSAPGAEVEEADALATPSYFVLESFGQGGPYQVSRANGGLLRCPDGHRAAQCTVALALPADCGWECQDGVLSGQGATLLRGALSGGTLQVAAAFDTYRAGLGTHPLYRLSPAPGGYQAVRLNASAVRALTQVDFSQADDPNYPLDPQRGLDQLARPEGLLASGSISRGVFHADRVWRQWSPALGCDADAAARLQAFGASPGPDEVDLTFATEAEAERYQDPQGRTVRWLVATTRQASGQGYTSGINDLWAQRFVVADGTCAVTVTEEH